MRAVIQNHITVPQANANLRNACHDVIFRRLRGAAKRLDCEGLHRIHSRLRYSGAVVRAPVRLGPGERWSGTQTLTAG
jgi:hypothetical protein